MEEVNTYAWHRYLAALGPNRKVKELMGAMTILLKSLTIRRRSLADVAYVALVAHARAQYEPSNHKQLCHSRRSCNCRDHNREESVCGTNGSLAIGGRGRAW